MITADFQYDPNFFGKVANKVKSIMDQRIRNGLQEAAEIFLEECRRLTPEDTREMLNSYEVSTIENSGFSYIITISNKAKHAIYVEYGVSGQKFNYHKPKGSVTYSGVGNRTMARALDNKRAEMRQALIRNIG